MKTSLNRSMRVATALAALWLSACGGGGDDDPVAQAPAPAPAPPVAQGPAPAPAPAPAPSPAPATPAAPVAISSNTTATANSSLAVTGTNITVTLPDTATLAVGNTVRVTGTANSSWNVRPNAGQTINTTGLTTTTEPAWTASTMPARTWHWVASNPAGDVLAAANIPGEIYISTDGGTTWTPGAGLPAAQSWISVDMTPTASRMVAVAFTGAMYQSVDRGATWTRIDQAFNPTGVLEYESVTISDDGQRIVAAVLNGSIYTSADAGATFTPATAAGAAFTRGWRAVDMSSNGQVVVAAAQQTGGLHLSTDGGRTFAPLPVAVGGTAVADGWYRVAISRDGNTIAVAGNTEFAGAASGLYVSRDRGVTWTRAAPAADYTSIAMSATGSTIAATMSAPTGQVIVSTNGGQTFAPLATPTGETNWRAVALSGDGLQYVLAAGRFFGAAGQLYTSLGVLTGRQTDVLDLEYAGNGQFNVRPTSTGAFSVR